MGDTILFQKMSEFYLIQNKRIHTEIQEYRLPEYKRLHVKIAEEKANADKIIIDGICSKNFSTVEA